MTVLPGHAPTPSQIIGDLFATHSEAASLQAEASHLRALAASSAGYASHTFSVAQAARLGYEEKRHRLDPRRLHSFDFGVGLLVLTLLAAVLTLLDVAELSWLLGGTRSVGPALAATAAWLGGAWLAALASRERRWGVDMAATAMAVMLGMLFVVMYRFGRQDMVFGILASALILILAILAAVLMARMESGSLFAARRRWHRAQAAHEAAVRTAQEDMQAATVATEAWLGMVRTQASTLTSDEHVVRETVALAAALIDSGRPQIPSA